MRQGAEDGKDREAMVGGDAKEALLTGELEGEQWGSLREMGRRPPNRGREGAEQDKRAEESGARGATRNWRK